MNEFNEQLLPQFCCNFITNNSLKDNCFQSDSYLRQNQLKWLLEKNDNYYNNLNYNQTIDLFDLNINSNDFNSKQMQIGFCFLKKTFNKLRDISTKRSLINGSVDCDYRKLRNNVCAFLAILRRRLFEVCIQCKPNVNQFESNNTFCVSVLKEILSFLSFVERVSKFRTQMIELAINSEEKTSIYNYFHSYLDIWWAVIEVMYILDQNKEINFSNLWLLDDHSSDPLCLQTIKLVLFDLIIVSVNRFNDIKESNKYQKLSLFNCFCVKQMYVLIRHMFEAINKSVTNDSFFQQIFCSLNRLTTSPTNQRSVPLRGFKLIVLDNQLIKEQNLHYIWFVTNIVQTFNYDISGQFIQSSDSPSIPLSLLKRITEFFKQIDSKFNENISTIIVFYMKSINFWKPNSDLLLPFVQHFLKNLSKNYFKANVEELVFIPKTSTKWIQITAEISSNRNNTIKDNCFYLFLSLMSQQLCAVFERSDSKTKLKNWQKFKGKVVVNVPNELGSFGKTAIYNLLSFYLVLIKTNEEIFIDFIDIIFETIVRINNNPNHLELVLNFLLALLQIKPNSLSEQKICAFIGKIFVENLQREELSTISSIIPFIEEFVKFDSNADQLIVIFNEAVLRVPLTDQKTKECLLSLIGGITQVLAKQKKERILLENQVFKQYIERNLSNECTFGRLFNIITIICKSCPHLFHDFIGQITRTIESMERKRGVGSNCMLRKAFHEFVNQKL